jgi:hypothetical protein
LHVSRHPKQYRRVRRSVHNSAQQGACLGVHQSFSFGLSAVFQKLHAAACTSLAPGPPGDSASPESTSGLALNSLHALHRKKYLVHSSPPHTLHHHFSYAQLAIRWLSHHRYVECCIRRRPLCRPASACSWPHRSPPIKVASVRARRSLTGATRCLTSIHHSSPDADWLSVLVHHQH